MVRIDHATIMRGAEPTSNDRDQHVSAALRSMKSRPPESRTSLWTLPADSLLALAVAHVGLSHQHAQWVGKRSGYVTLKTSRVSNCRQPYSSESDAASGAAPRQPPLSPEHDHSRTTTESGCCLEAIPRPGSKRGNTRSLDWGFLKCLFPPCWRCSNQRGRIHGGNRHGLSDYMEHLSLAM